MPLFEGEGRAGMDEGTAFHPAAEHRFRSSNGRADPLEFLLRYGSDGDLIGQEFSYDDAFSNDEADHQNRE